MTDLDDATTLQMTALDPTADQAIEEQPTEQLALLTAEQTIFDEPLPLPVVAEPAYLVEARSPQRAPRLLAVRGTLEEALRLADGVHPAVADVTIHEFPLPCDLASLLEALDDCRSWSREASGTWSPALPQ